MAVAPTGLSLEEFLQLPEEEPALEYVDGEVRRKVSPNLRHGLLELKLVEAARRNRVALAVPEVRATFGGQSRVPDVSVFRWERVQRDAQGEAIDDVLIPPDIAIEVVSASQSVNALLRRCRWYVRNSVEIALLVDPANRSVVAFLGDGTVHEWRADDRIELEQVIPQFDLTVEQLFMALKD
jgi:Uma2 family endonuclease